MKRITALVLAGLLLTQTAQAGMESFTPSVVYTPFPDVAASAWYAADVQQAYELGLINGKSDGRFDPAGALTLAEAVTLAAKVRSIYEGGGFTPGGTPWYRNAVQYGQQVGFLTTREYEDYTAPATRADMAGIFAYALPSTAYPRINRVGALPDVTAQTAYSHEIYFLYHAGILTGGPDGSYQPDATITRAEAAAILNRLALPDSRKPFTYSDGTGQITTSDGGVKLTIPAGWTQQSDGLFFQCGPADGSVKLELLALEKTAGQSLPGMTAALVQGLQRAEGGALLLTEQPENRLFRGLPCARFVYELQSETPTAVTVYCFEGPSCYYALSLSVRKNAGAEAEAQLKQAAFSFDLALS